VCTRGSVRALARGPSTSPLGITGENAVPRLILGFPLLVFALTAFAADPECDGPGNYAASMVFVRLKNAGLVDNYNIDFSKTKVVRLASQRIGKDLYRQVHHVTYFFKLTGETIEAITVNDASHQECSMSGVDIFLIKQRFPAD
jgi:hypothetical protein